MSNRIESRQGEIELSRRLQMAMQGDKWVHLGGSVFGRRYGRSNGMIEIHFPERDRMTGRATASYVHDPQSPKSVRELEDLVGRNRKRLSPRVKELIERVAFAENGTDVHIPGTRNATGSVDRYGYNFIIGGQQHLLPITESKAQLILSRFI